MEELNISNHDSQQNQGSTPQFNNPYNKISLPNSVGALVLGIVSIFFSIIWCYWIGSIISLVCGIIGLVLAKNGKNLSNSNLNTYSQSSINNNNAGWIMCIIGVCISAIEFLTLIIGLIFFGAMASSFKNWPY